MKAPHFSHNSLEEVICAPSICGSKGHFSRAPTNSWDWHAGSWLVLPRESCHLQGTVGIEMLPSHGQWLLPQPYAPLGRSALEIFREKQVTVNYFYIAMITFHFCFVLLYTPQYSRTPRLPTPIPLQLLFHPIQRAPQGMGLEEPLACGENEGSASAPSPISPTSGASAAFTCPDLWPHEL